MHGTTSVDRGTGLADRIPGEEPGTGPLVNRGGPAVAAIPSKAAERTTPRNLVAPPRLRAAFHVPIAAGHAVHASISVLSFVLLAVLAVIGTDRLGRPLTDEEKRRFGALLREHDYPGVRLIALRYAYKLTRSRLRAQDLMGRVDLRLVTGGWDPAEVSLASRLCRLVWSEWTHVDATDQSARRAEKGFLRELEVTEGVTVPSTEQRVVAAETDASVRTKGEVQLEKLRVMFEAQKDEVNLYWLKRSLEGENDMTRMARESGRDISEFRAAAKRRHRAVRRLLANDRGVDSPEDES